MKNALKRIVMIGLLVSASGCAMIPSFWDNNQSAKAIDIRQSIEQITCDSYSKYMAILLKNDIEWFVLYSESKGTKDVLEMSKKMQSTVDSLVAKGESVSPTYCNAKKTILQQQSKMFAKSVLGRF